MHEKILQGLTVGIVGGLIVYWLTSGRHEGFQSTQPGEYTPLYGDLRQIRGGTPTCACCRCCGLGTPETNSNPLASDYLCDSPDYAEPTSNWNIGISLQVSCRGIDLDSTVHRDETATSFPHGISGPNTNPRPLILANDLSCSPNVPLQVDCTEVV